MNGHWKTVSILSAFLALTYFIVVGLGSTLIPLIISLALAYLLFPVIRWTESRGIKRHWAVIGVFALMSITSLITTALVLPGLLRDGRDFFAELPRTAALALDRLEQLLSLFGYQVHLSQQGLKEILAQHASEISTQFLQSSAGLIKNAFTNILAVVVFFLNLSLIPLFFFHLVDQYEVISREVKSLVPPALKPRMSRYLDRSNAVLIGYFRGQLLVALILGTLYAIGFSLAGLKFGLFIGLATGAMSIVPFVGPIFGFLIAIAIALANYSGFGPIIGVVLVFMVVQALEGTVITPKLVGDSVGLGVLPTMLALIIGGNWFGIVGMMVAIPTAAILKHLLIDLKREYQASELYLK